MKKLIFLFLLITALSFSEDFELAQKTFWVTDENRIEHYTPNFNSGEKVRISYTIYYNKKPTSKNRHLVIYNHGGGGSSGENIGFFYQLAKKDFVVLSIAHKYLSGTFIEEDGKRVGQGPSNLVEGSYNNGYTSSFYKDTLVALEHFKGINSSQLDNLANTNVYMATGWSVGGAIAGILLNEEANCIGAINFDGNNLNMKSSYKYNKPFLMYLSTQFLWDERADTFKIREINPNNANYLIYKDTIHMDFRGINPTKKEFSNSVLSSSIDFISKVFKNESYKENLAKLDNDETIFFDRIPKSPKDYSLIIMLSILGLGVLGFGIKRFKK